MKILASSRLAAHTVNVRTVKGITPSQSRGLQTLIEKYEGTVLDKPSNGTGNWEIEFDSKGDRMGFQHEVEQKLPTHVMVH